ncbi:MAG: hypothetical protein D6776_02970 [Planctomycetota bacterium]|nr:MAG: hypothetical protein D6776_02970 [Planctomycetota bacterium]
MAVTDAMMIGENCGTRKSPMITSTANSAPATGALKIAAMPAAAPQPTSVRSRRSPTRRNCPSTEPVPAPICTIGPSEPAEPPEPIVSVDAIAFTIGTRGRMRPPRVATAAMTSGTPCPFASEAKRQMM